MKVCTNCDTNKDLSEFYNNIKSSDGKSWYCKPCQKAKVAAYQKTDRGKVTFKRSQRKFNDTPHGRAQKQKWEGEWKKTEKGRAYDTAKSLRRYYSDPAHYRLKTIARRLGCLVGVLKEVRERDKYCQMCFTDEDLQFDHIYPVSLGGRGTLENLQLLCGPCNNFKSNNLVLEGEGGMLVTQACNI